MEPVGYSGADQERWFSEPAKPSGRTPFERDRARVLHSAGFRRLALTTQVISPGTDSFVRNRLTHSLEVAQIARDLGRAVGCDPDVVDAAGLAHDLGHPPFGHTGEAVLDSLTRAIGGFEGNAQTLRVLTRLEPKVLGGEPRRSAGLNLTRATLDAVSKYPWPRARAPVPAAGGQSPPGSSGVSSDRSRKFGVYDADLAVFRWFREGRPDGRRCLEAQVMDFADDVAYSVHDVEDAVVAGHVDLDRLADSDQQRRVIGLVRSWFLPDLGYDEGHAAFARLRGLPYWPSQPGSDRQGHARLKALTSGLIGRFSSTSIAATRESNGQSLCRYDGDLVVPRDIEQEVAILKGVAGVYVMGAPSRRREYARQREVVAGLYGALLERAPACLDVALAQDWCEAPDDDARRRVVVDQLASLSDVAALAWHRRLVEPTSPEGPVAA